MKSWGLQGWKEQWKLTEDLTVFEAKSMIAEKEFIILQEGAKLSQNKPLGYYF